MFHLGGKNDSAVYGVLFHISSGSVQASIVASYPGRTLPLLIYENHTRLRVSTEPSDVRRVREAILSLALTLSQDGITALRAHDRHARITRTLVSCGSPWSYALARTVSYENDEPFKVTKTLLEDLIESAEKELRSSITEETTRSKDFTIVEQTTTDILINDYEVANPIGKTGISCALSHMVGLVPTELVHAFTELHDKLFPESELTIHTYLLTEYCVLRDIYPDTTTCTIIDVSAESTEFGIIENNLLVENASILQGSNTFIRAVAEETGRPISDIETLIATNQTRHTLELPELAQQTELYVTAISDCLHKIATRKTLPHDILITIHHPYGQLFKDILHKAFLATTHKEPNSLALQHNLLFEVIPGTSCGIHMAVTLRFFHKLHSCGGLRSE